MSIYGSYVTYIGNLYWIE